MQPVAGARRPSQVSVCRDVACYVLPAVVQNQDVASYVSMTNGNLQK